MSTPVDSATAYDRLARISAQAEFADKISFDWLKLKRALETLREDYFLLEDRDEEMYEKLDELIIMAIKARQAFRAIADTKTARAIELNERIQNGVYNG